MRIRRGGVTRHVSQRAFDTKFKQQGYEIVEDLDAKKENFDVKEITVEIDGEKIAENMLDEFLQDKTVDELREIAKEKELTGYYSLKKDELIAEIKKVE